MARSLSALVSGRLFAVISFTSATSFLTAISEHTTGMLKAKNF
jgi:hypothetical protein